MRYVQQFITVLVLISVLYAGENDALKNQDISVSDLRVEYLTDPIGLDVENPRFAWNLEGSERGTIQSAYQVIVSESRKAVESGKGEIWNTRKVDSQQSVNVRYDGEPLESGEKYYWRVRVWDAEDQRSQWSSVQTFRMGVLNNSEWEADWILNPDTTVSAPLFRREFNTGKEIESAHAYVTGVGYYEFYLNGKKMADHVLDPGMTDFRKRILYETYDITDQLAKEKNVIGLMLGNGAYRLKATEGRYIWPSNDHAFGAPKGLLQLHINYEDGTEEVIVSDKSWKTSAGPVVYNNVFGGEDYDARLEQEGWSQAGFDDTGWDRVQIAERPDVELDSQLLPPIRVTQTISPVERINPEPGVHLFDLGQNIPGWWRIRVKGARGTELKIRGAETLNDSLFPTPMKDGDKLSTKHDYHKNVWTTYILKGEGTEIYEPRFFYTGYRYIEVKVDRPDQLEALRVDGRVVHSDLKRSGHFSSSDTLLNRIYRASVWSQRGNLHGYPTDCPHREKGGYNGDGQVIAEASMHDFHMRPFYEKWLNDMNDAQQENGRIPNTSPTIVGGYGGGIAWGSAYILIPWWMHQYYDDKEILKQHYPAMGNYLEYLGDLARNDSIPGESYIINEFGGYWDSLGEWCAPGEDTCANNPLVSTYYWYLDAKTMADIAGVLGKTDDQKRYRALADTIKQAFNEKFFNPKTNLYGHDEPYQTYLLFALDQDLVPDGHRAAVLNHLVDDIMITREGHLGTGILGTKHLFGVLAGEDREDILHTMVTKRTYPGWGFWIENGATTLWERWNGENSHNHQMFGSVNEYFYKYLAGIRAPTDQGTTAGYGEILIEPFVPGDLQHAEAFVETVRGKVSSAWTQTADRLTLEVTLPANSTGNVTIPAMGAQNITVTEGDTVIWNRDKFVEGAEGITGGARKGDYVTFEVKSGRYTFVLKSNE